MNRIKLYNKEIPNIIFKNLILLNLSYIKNINIIIVLLLYMENIIKGNINKEKKVTYFN